MIECEEAGWPLKSTAGATVLELLIALSAGVVILAAAMQSFSFFQRQFVSQQSAVAQQQDLRLGLELLEEELHLTEPEALSIIRPDEIEFGANISGLVTTTIATASRGQITLSVKDGRGWANRKTIVVCWNDQCDTMMLARDGQGSLLTIDQPLAVSIPAGASVSVKNTVRYYCKRDENGIWRFLRQVDGGASVLVGDVSSVRFLYWTAQGRTAAAPALVRRITVEMSLAGQRRPTIREIGLRA
ncbi:MAG TPA: hypothetical protein VFS39_16735 [Nitrospira sp.]|nr:hypothetical protein [Nitrospira sp.]